MTDLAKTFLLALKESFIEYQKEGGTRSNKKLIPIHSWISNIIRDKLKGNYKIKSLGVKDNKEYKFNGKYYPKNLDITILNEEKPITTISFKFVTSNYKQNGNNYFENLLGETANIRRENLGFCHLLVLRGHTPYYNKNKGNLRGELQKEEIINDKDLTKYINLFKDIDFPHKPEVIGICIVDIDKKNSVVFTDLDKIRISEKIQKILNKEFSIEYFIKKVCELTKFKT